MRENNTLYYLLTDHPSLRSGHAWGARPSRHYIHNGLANDKTYTGAVLNDLEKATSREEAIETLQRIGQRLLELL